MSLFNMGGNVLILTRVGLFRLFRGWT